MTEVSHADIKAEIAALKVEVVNLKDDVAEIKRDIKPLTEAAAVGKGALIVLLKIGAGIAALFAAAAWLFDRFNR